MNRPLLANLAALAAALSAGVSVVATRLVIGETDAVSLAFYRYAIAALCLIPILPFVYPRISIPVADFLKIALLGTLFFGLFPWVFSLSLQWTSAARGAVGLATIPIQTLIVAALFGREALTRYKILGVGLAFIGILVVFGSEVTNGLNSDYLFGDGLMLFGAFNAAIYSVFSRPLLERYGSTFVTTLAVLFGVLALFPATLATGSIQAWPSFTTKGWGAIIFLGTMGGAIQFLLFSWALRWLAPTRTVIYLALNPLTAVLLALVLLREAIPPNLLVGLSLVLSGILLPIGRGVRTNRFSAKTQLDAKEVRPSALDTPTS